MIVMLMNKFTNELTVIDNAISVRIGRNFFGVECWEVEYDDDAILRSPCAIFYIYLHYERK